jgi:hypothetical protein
MKKLKDELHIPQEMIEFAAKAERFRKFMVDCNDLGFNVPAGTSLILDGKDRMFYNLRHKTLKEFSMSITISNEKILSIQYKGEYAKTEMEFGAFINRTKAWLRHELQEALKQLDISTYKPYNFFSEA